MTPTPPTPTLTEAEEREEIRKKLLVTINILAMDIENHGLFVENHNLYAERILDEIQTFLKARERKAREEALSEFGRGCIQCTGPVVALCSKCALLNFIESKD